MILKGQVPYMCWGIVIPRHMISFNYKKNDLYNKSELVVTFTLAMLFTQGTGIDEGREN
jgi:hypothetical protein